MAKSSPGLSPLRASGRANFRHAAAFSRHDASEFCQAMPPNEIRGRGECRVPNAPAASCALCSFSMHTSIHSGGTGNIRHSPRDGFTAYFVLSPVTGLFCHRRPRDKPRDLDASVGASGPHDFAVRISALVSRHQSVHRIPHPTSVTIAIRPSCGAGQPEHYD